MQFSKECLGYINKFLSLALPLIMALSSIKASASHPKPDESPRPNSANALEYFLNTPLGKEVDGFFPPTNLAFTGLAADLLKVSRTDLTSGQLKDFSSIIFEWAEQHPELGSPEFLSALGGLGIIKTESGFSVLYYQAEKLMIIDYSRADAQAIFQIILERLKNSGVSLLKSLTFKLLKMNQTSSVDWIKELDTLSICYDDLPIDPETGKRIDCCYDKKNKLCEINKSTPRPFPTQEPN